MDTTNTSTIDQTIAILQRRIQERALDKNQAETLMTLWEKRARFLREKREYTHRIEEWRREFEKQKKNDEQSLVLHYREDAIRHQVFRLTSFVWNASFLASHGETLLSMLGAHKKLTERQKTVSKRYIAGAFLDRKERYMLLDLFSRIRPLWPEEQELMRRFLGFFGVINAFCDKDFYNKMHDLNNQIHAKHDMVLRTQEDALAHLSTKIHQNQLSPESLRIEERLRSCEQELVYYESQISLLSQEIDDLLQ